MSGHIEISPRDIMDIATGFQRARPLLTAFELDLFTVLNDEPKTSDQVAAAVGADPRATDRLMNALTALGLLEKHGGHFSNGPAASKHLVKGKPDYMAGLRHTAHLWNTWSNLTETVRRGTPAPRPPTNDRGEEWLRAFIAAMHWRARASAPLVVNLLDLDGVSRVLDVGGGSGAYAMAFARRGISAVVFDLPNVLPLTRAYVQNEGLSAEVETVPGDYLRDSLPGGFDLVFLSAIVHSNSFDENRALIAKAAGALRAGGQVVVQEFLMNEDRSGPLQPALFALNMLVGTERGDTYTESEVGEWMRAAGLGNLRRRETDFGTNLVVGRKATD